MLNLCNVRIDRMSTLYSEYIGPLSWQSLVCLDTQTGRVPTGARSGGGVWHCVLRLQLDFCRRTRTCCAARTIVQRDSGEAGGGDKGKYRMAPNRMARFPSGRIKKIMQLDEEVGKIAKATPILVSKCVEKLIEELMKKTIEVTKSKGVSIVSAKHLQEAVAKTTTFDFLQGVVGRFVPSAEDESKVIGSDIEEEGHHESSDSDDDNAEGFGGGRGRGRGAGRGRGRGRGRGGAKAAEGDDDGETRPAKRARAPRGRGGGVAGTSGRGQGGRGQRGKGRKDDDDDDDSDVDEAKSRTSAASSTTNPHQYANAHSANQHTHHGIPSMSARAPMSSDTFTHSFSASTMSISNLISPMSVSNLLSSSPVTSLSNLLSSNQVTPLSHILSTNQVAQPNQFSHRHIEDDYDEEDD